MDNRYFSYVEISVLAVQRMIVFPSTKCVRAQRWQGLEHQTVPVANLLVAAGKNPVVTTLDRRNHVVSEHSLTRNKLD